MDLYIYAYIHICSHNTEKGAMNLKGNKRDMIPLEEDIGEGMNREKEFVLPLSHF